MNICVYGAARNDIHPDYIAAGEALGRRMAARGHVLVYGGGGNGLMGAAARGIHEGGGKSIGIVPSFFNVDGVLFPHTTELIYTETMRERKQLMEARSDAFVMTPGGIGTFDEFFEILTLRSLGRHDKPIAILNTRGYYDSVRELLDKAVTEGFMTPDKKQLYCFFEEPEALLCYLEAELAR
ncbi:MAG: TIGR00730 family Rossman fold protein [Clostridia bacterium]|nr:TIGR00730 family Rossman fold protein [Clostridia bacterium]